MSESPGLTTIHPSFGSSIIGSEPCWYQGAPTPYYNASHVALRSRTRAWVVEVLMPWVAADSAGGPTPLQTRQLIQSAASAGIYSMQFPASAGGSGGRHIDPFACLIVSDELARCGAGGLVATVFVMNIGLPPLLPMQHTHPKWDSIVRECTAGRARIALAVTEPETGSDVAGICTTAVRDPSDPDYFIVNGSKKFITGGLDADYYTTAVRTGGPGMGGISLLLIPGSAAGISTRRIATQGWCSSGTAFVNFEAVRVPVSNIIGVENQGFLAIMRNFNMERFGLAVQAVRYARICYEDAFRYSQVRKTFGKRLHDHQVIRAKLGDMLRRISAAHALNESIAAMLAAEDAVNPTLLASQVALAKVECSYCMEFCAREASQILGGNSFVRDAGPGERVERIYREVRVNVVGGGSAEILTDLAVRLCLRAKV